MYTRISIAAYDLYKKATAVNSLLNKNNDNVFMSPQNTKRPIFQILYGICANAIKRFLFSLHLSFLGKVFTLVFLDLGFGVVPTKKWSKLRDRAIRSHQIAELEQVEEEEEEEEEQVEQVEQVEEEEAEEDQVEEEEEEEEEQVEEEEEEEE